MEYVRNLIRIVGGVVLIFAAVFGVVDFNLDPVIEQIVTYIAYLLLLLLGGQQVRAGYRGLRK